MRTACGILVGVVLSCPSQAFAQVTLPSGQVVPTDSANGEVQLYSFFTTRGEAIDWIADARNEPDTFSPLCEFTAALLLHEAGSSLGVGWYNVVPGAPAAPTAAEVHQIVPPGAAVGTVITGASIRDDPSYAGGEIGFALMRSPLHFTEARWNTVCDSGPCAATPGPWILSLSYLSTTMADAFYVAFEDGNTSSSSWNNDGDYNDYVFFFTGIACSGAGEPCTVAAAMGICANGLTECAAAGALECRQVNMPRTEECDGADNDCNGSIDEGDLCPVGEVCSRGQCVGDCELEFGCLDPADACEDGLCVDAECVGVSCSPGLACVAGDCVAPCDGVTCPGDQVCQVGVCLDPCAGVTCEAGEVCQAGVCVTSCMCRPCGTGLECGGSGGCVDAGCASITCAPGTVCRAGACVDACAGAVCPRGQACEGGACVDVPPSTGMDGGATDGATDGDGASGGDGGGGGGAAEPGCACRVARARPNGSLWLVGAAVALWIARRRRRSIER